MRSTWQSIFDKEIVRPFGLGLSYVSAMKETMEIEFQDKRIRVAQREAEGEENIERLSVLSVWRCLCCLCGAAQFLTALAATAAAAVAASASPR